MKRFIKFYQKDKQNIKMINQSEKGFELVILSDALLETLLETINNCEEKGDDIDIVWQMKHKAQNYIVYKNCVFSAPMDNIAPKTNNGILQRRGFSSMTEDKMLGKKIKVTCSGTSYYSESYLFKNRTIKKTKNTYKDAMLLERMLKIGELNYISKEEEIELIKLDKNENR